MRTTTRNTGRARPAGDGWGGANAREGCHLHAKRFCGNWHFRHSIGILLGCLLRSGWRQRHMDPNILLQTGSHFLFNLSLAGTGFIDATSIDLAQGTNIQVLTHTSPATYSNGPFKFFSDGISADCGHGGSSGGCGSTLSFTIDNFSGFLFATTQFNNMNIIAAADALLTDCTGGCTGPVGLTGDLTPTPFAVPTPIAGSGPLFISGLGGLWALMRRRKKKLGLDLPISRRQRRKSPNKNWLRRKPQLPVPFL